MPAALNCRACMMLIASCRSARSGRSRSGVFAGVEASAGEQKPMYPPYLNRASASIDMPPQLPLAAQLLEDLEERDVERRLDRVVGRVDGQVGAPVQVPVEVRRPRPSSRRTSRPGWGRTRRGCPWRPPFVRQYRCRTGSEGRDNDADVVDRLDAVEVVDATPGGGVGEAVRREDPGHLPVGPPRRAGTRRSPASWPGRTVGPQSTSRPQPTPRTWRRQHGGRGRQVAGVGERAARRDVRRCAEPSLSLPSQSSADTRYQ